MYTIVLELTVGQVAESMPCPMHAGKTHPCAALPVNTLACETLQTWSERLLGKGTPLRDEQMP